MQELINEQVTFEAFFQKAKLNPNAHLIKGVICGYRVEEIENPLTKQVMYFLVSYNPLINILENYGTSNTWLY